MLLGQRLILAGLPFIEAKAVHRPDGLHVQIVVCKTDKDAFLVREWAERERLVAIVRVATPEEIAEAEYWEKNA